MVAPAGAVALQPAAASTTTAQLGARAQGPWVPASERAARPAVTSWEALLREKDLSRARRYSVRSGPAESARAHGLRLGLVQEDRGDKISVAFKADVKDAGARKKTG